LTGHDGIARVGGHFPRAFEELFRQSLFDFNGMECNNLDLFALKEQGTKLLLLHSARDDPIPSDGAQDTSQRGGSTPIGPPKKIKEHPSFGGVFFCKWGRCLKKFRGAIFTGNLPVIP
jgi:hypothetical protein